MINKAVLFGLAMATVDVVILSLLKMRHTGQLKTNWIFPIAFVVYGCQALVFYKALDYSNLTNMNLLWDISSDVIVTFVGLYLFKEAVTPKQKLGIVFGFIALMLLK